MTVVLKRAIFRRTTTWLTMLIMLSAILPLPAQAVGAFQSPAEANHSSPNAIPSDQIRVAADKQSNGSDLGIKATANGAELRANFQDLAGRLSAEGLWLHSTAEETADTSFRVLATAVGRGLGVARPLADTGWWWWTNRSPASSAQG